VPKSRAKRPDARILRSRAAMRQALLALLEEMPLDAITGARIAERAGVGYATFFRHYADVRAVLVDTVAALTDDLAEGMRPALQAADSAAAAAALVDAVAARRTMFCALLVGAGDALRAELARQVIERVEALPDLAPSWLPRRLAKRVAVMGTIELLDWWLREEPERDPAEVAVLLDRLVIGRLHDASPPAASAPAAS
jgi:AcrR family transcriptional regulator